MVQNVWKKTSVFYKNAQKSQIKLASKKKWDTDQILTKLKIDSVHFAENL